MNLPPVLPLSYSRARPVSAPDAERDRTSPNAAMLDLPRERSSSCPRYRQSASAMRFVTSPSPSFRFFSTINARVDYLLSDEAIQAGSVAVEEVSGSGSVPNLIVTNRGDSRVLFLEGEELRGPSKTEFSTRQCWSLRTARLAIPVSCVEHGRWQLPVAAVRVE